MKVHMFFTIMLVGVGVHAVLQCFVKSPETDANQQYTHQAFTPRGEQIQRQQITQKQRQQADQGHAGGMSDAPSDAWQPGPGRLPHREGRNGRQVVGARPYMQGAGN
jgi:hypothetical protein